MSDELYQAIGRIRPLSGEGKVVYYLGASYPGDLATGLVSYKIDTALIWIDQPAPASRVILDPASIGERVRTSPLSQRKLSEVLEVDRETLSALAKEAEDVGDLRELVVVLAEEGVKQAEIVKITGLARQRVSEIVSEQN